MITSKELTDLLTLERKDEYHFVGQNYKTACGRAFGVLVIVQSLHAAYQTGDRVLLPVGCDGRGWEQKRGQQQHQQRARAAAARFTAWAGPGACRRRGHFAQSSRCPRSA